MKIKQKHYDLIKEIGMNEHILEILKRNNFSRMIMNQHLKELTDLYEQLKQEGIEVENEF